MLHASNHQLSWSPPLRNKVLLAYYEVAGSQGKEDSAEIKEGEQRYPPFSPVDRTLAGGDGF